MSETAVHPGKLIAQRLEAAKIKPATLAQMLDISHSSISRLLAGKAGVTPDMAIRLGYVLGDDSSYWLLKQAAWDIAQAAKAVDLNKLTKL